MIRTWNNHHMVFPELRCMVRERAFHAHCTGCQRSRILGPASQGSSYLAERMSDETAKHTMLLVAEVCDRFAIGAAMCSIYELAVSNVIDRMKGS